MFIITHRKYFYALSLGLIILSVAFVGVWGLRLGLDFTGGTVMELEYRDTRPNLDALSKAFYDSGITGAALQLSGERGVIARFGDISQTEHEILIKKLSGDTSDLSRSFVEKRFTTIGPIIGKELKQSSMKALGLVIVSIMFYIAWAFRKVSAPISSWKYGVIAIVALLHDVFIPAGFFAFLGYMQGVEVDILFITALLTILGFSVHDTIVVFDRIREKLVTLKGRKPFEELVGESITETITRSINTSLTTVMTLAAVYFWGGETTKYFSLLLIIGIIVGTYSSIFIASPLLVTWEKFQRKNS